MPEAQLVDKIVTNQGLNRLDDELEGKECICGSRVTMADLMLYGFMSMMLQVAPWLNPIEPRWVHGKRAVVEPTRMLTAAELIRRVCEYFDCEHVEHLKQ